LFLVVAASWLLALAPADEPPVIVCAWAAAVTAIA
jgi:hypothetical protein